MCVCVFVCACVHLFVCDCLNMFREDMKCYRMYSFGVSDQSLCISVYNCVDLCGHLAP